MRHLLCLKAAVYMAIVVGLSLTGCSNSSNNKTVSKPEQDSTDTKIEETVRPLVAMGLVPNQAVLPKPPMELNIPIFSE